VPARRGISYYDILMKIKLVHGYKHLSVFKIWVFLSVDLLKFVCCGGDTGGGYQNSTRGSRSLSLH